MRRLLELLVLALGLAAGTNAGAKATALVIVDGAPVVDLSSTGFSWIVSNESVTLAPGQSADVHYTWSVSVKDDGLPNVFAGPPFESGFPPTGCMPLFVFECGPQPSGFEQAKASLMFGYRDSRIADVPVARGGPRVIDCVRERRESASGACGITRKCGPRPRRGACFFRGSA